MARANDNLALRYARRHVAHFKDEQEKLMAEHRDAMDCYDCEAFLQLGIDAYNWLVMADNVAHKLIYSGAFDKQQAAEVTAILEELFRRWLGPCAYAEQWIAKQKEREFEIENLKEFVNCLAEVRAMVDAFSSDGHDIMSAQLILLRDQALLDHSNGTTAEYV